MDGFLTFVLLVCASALIFVLGALTGRAYANWSQEDDNAALRLEIRRLGKKMVDDPRH